MEGKYVLIPVIKVKHIHIFLLSSRILESLSTALHDGIDEGLMPCNIAVIYVMVHNLNAVFHKVMVSLRSAKEKNISLRYRWSVSTDQNVGQHFSSTCIVLVFLLLRVNAIYGNYISTKKK